MKRRTMWFSTGPTQTELHKHRRWLEAGNFGLLYYPFSENKGADQLRSYCEADLRLCFRICRLFIFMRWLIYFTDCSIIFVSVSHKIILGKEHGSPGRYVQ